MFHNLLEMKIQSTMFTPIHIRRSFFPHVPRHFHPVKLHYKHSIVKRKFQTHMIICSRTRIFKRWKVQIMATYRSTLFQPPLFIESHSSVIPFFVLCRKNIDFIVADNMSFNMHDVVVVVEMQSMFVMTYFEIPEKRKIDTN